MFTVTIETNNAAFDEGPASEIARVLREIAQRVEQEGEFDGTVHDINGNSVAVFNGTP